MGLVSLHLKPPAFRELADAPHFNASSFPSTGHMQVFVARWQVDEGRKGEGEIRPSLSLAERSGS